MPKEMPNPAKGKWPEVKCTPIGGLDEIGDLYTASQLKKTLPFWKGSFSK
jgi:hypothetical protein